MPRIRRGNAGQGYWSRAGFCPSRYWDGLMGLKKPSHSFCSVRFCMPPTAVTRCYFSSLSLCLCLSLGIVKCLLSLFSLGLLRWKGSRGGMTKSCRGGNSPRTRQWLDSRPTDREATLGDIHFVTAFLSTRHDVGYTDENKTERHWHWRLVYGSKSDKLIISVITEMIKIQTLAGYRLVYHDWYQATTPGSSDKTLLRIQSWRGTVE